MISHAVAILFSLLKRPSYFFNTITSLPKKYIFYETLDPKFYKYRY